MKVSWMLVQKSLFRYPKSRANLYWQNYFKMLSVNSQYKIVVSSLGDDFSSPGLIQELISKVCNAEQHFNYVVETTHRTKLASSSTKLTMEELNTTTMDTLMLSKNIQKDI